MNLRALLEFVCVNKKSVIANSLNFIFIVVIKRSQNVIKLTAHVFSNFYANSFEIFHRQIFCLLGHFADLKESQFS